MSDLGAGPSGSVHVTKKPGCAFVCLCLTLGGAGCGDPTAIAVDLSADKPRFVIHHVTWGWPFRWPRVQEFAIASNEDGALWDIKSIDEAGVPARELGIVYGEVPPGFAQVSPEQDARPKPLVGGRMYFVGATGPESVYRTVFALPIGMLGPPPDRPLPQTPKRQNVETPKPEGQAETAR